MIRTHISPIIIDKLIQRDQKEGIWPIKPQGFWYEIDGSWREWCSGERFNLGYYNYLYDVQLTDDINLLKLSTETEVDGFHSTYAKSSYYPQWKEVINQYDGIEINPYPYECRFEYVWFNSWDIPSGCVWNIDKIRIELRGPFNMTMRVTSKEIVDMVTSQEEFCKIYGVDTLTINEDETFEITVEEAKRWGLLK